MHTKKGFNKEKSVIVVTGSEMFVLMEGVSSVSYPRFNVIGLQNFVLFVQWGSDKKNSFKI